MHARVPNRCRSLLNALLACCLWSAAAFAGDEAAPAARQHAQGVLVLAHGGSPAWDRTVRRTVKQARLNTPTAIAFGMGFHRREAEAMQAAVERLEREGVTEIVVVPLLVSSASEVYRQLEFLLGQRAEPGVTPEFLGALCAPGAQAGPPSQHEPPEPVRAHAAIRMALPLNDDPAVGEILLARARALSRRPARETVILVAHGPNTDADNAFWLACLERLAQTVREGGGFRVVETATLRDDAPQEVYDQATQRLRALVERADQEGEALVVPVLVARGGIEAGIPKRLQGLRYRYSGRTLLPDRRISRWLQRRAQAPAVR